MSPHCADPTCTSPATHLGLAGLGYCAPHGYPWSQPVAVEAFDPVWVEGQRLAQGDDVEAFLAWAAVHMHADTMG